MNISDERTLELVAEYGTPLYVLDEDLIVSNLERLRSGIAENYSPIEVTYSVKSNCLRSILTAVLRSGFRLEVVSDHELHLGFESGASSAEILVNGPGKSDALLARIYDRGLDTNLDSVAEVERAADLGSKARPFRAGLRIAPRLRNGELSRFGIDVAVPANLDRIRKVFETGRFEIDGLHVHHSSERSSQSFVARLDLLQGAARVLDVVPNYFDLGGGVPSEIPTSIAATLDYEIETPVRFAAGLGAALAQKLADHQIKVILEPGIGVLADAMIYLTSVVDVKATSTRVDVISDGSIFDVNPLRSGVSPPCRLVTNRPGDARPADLQLFGSTCMEIDKLGSLTGSIVPERGEVVVVSNVGAYSNVMSPEFIVAHAPVYSISDRRLVRDRQRLGEYTRAGR